MLMAAASAPEAPVPQRMLLPESDELVPQRILLPATEESVPQRMDVPQRIEVPQRMELLPRTEGPFATMETFPLASSLAMGERALPTVAGAN